MKDTKYVRLEKVAESDGAFTPAGNWNNYPLGESGINVSFPIFYWLEGWMHGELEIGKPVRILRMVRNGERTLGLARLTEVVEIRGEGEFRTCNSIYRITRLEQGPLPRWDELSQGDRFLFSLWASEAKPVGLKGEQPEGGGYFSPKEFLQWVEWMEASPR